MDANTNKINLSFLIISAKVQGIIQTAPSQVGLISILIPVLGQMSLFYRATPSAYGSSQARGQIRATAAGLHHGHSNAGSKLCLQPTPQFTATPDP